MATYRQNFEGITAGAAITAANSGTGGQNAVTPQVSNGTITAVSSPALVGSRSMLCHRTGTGWAYAQYPVSGETRQVIKFRFRYAIPTATESWAISRDIDGTAVTQVQAVSGSSHKLNLVTTGFGTRYTLPTGLTAGTDYDLFMACDTGTDTTDGKAAFWLRDTGGAFAGGMTAAVEYAGIDQGGGDDLSLAQFGMISSTAGTTDQVFDEIMVYSGLYGVGDLNPLAVPLASTLNAEPGSVVTLSGGTSTDPDGTITGWTWSQVSNGAPTVTLVGSGANRTFEVPATIADQDYVFKLVVTGTSGTSADAFITVTGMYATDKWRVGGVWLPALMKF